VQVLAHGLFVEETRVATALMPKNAPDYERFTKAPTGIQARDLLNSVKSEVNQGFATEGLCSVGRLMNQSNAKVKPIFCFVKTQRNTTDVVVKIRIFALIRGATWSRKRILCLVCPCRLDAHGENIVLCLRN